jgi:hypothetical protein
MSTHQLTLGGLKASKPVGLPEGRFAETYKVVATK